MSFVVVLPQNKGSAGISVLVVIPPDKVALTCGLRNQARDQRCEAVEKWVIASFLITSVNCPIIFSCFRCNTFVKNLN